MNAQGEEVFANKTHCHHRHNKVVIQKMANSPSVLLQYYEKHLQNSKDRCIVYTVVDISLCHPLNYCKL